MKERQSRSEETRDARKVYLDLLAELDMTKHFGGLEATDELIELCHIDGSKYVLDVGCGVGMTPCYIAKKYGCNVVGVDIHEKMIDRAEERAEREGVADRVEFRVADVRVLPFEDALFDVVIGESVVAFVEDKQKAVDECVRVTRPGGYVGLSEATWTKEPSPELLTCLSRALGGSLQVLDAGGWRRLVEESGLRDIVARTHEITVRSEAVNRFRRMGLKHIVRVWCRTLSLLTAKPAYRDFLKEVLSEPKELIEYWAYGTYVGRK
jgi:arsenite methyltransferase